MTSKLPGTGRKEDDWTEARRTLSFSLFYRQNLSQVAAGIFNCGCFNVAEVVAVVALRLLLLLLLLHQLGQLGNPNRGHRNLNVERTIRHDNYDTMDATEIRKAGLD